MRQSQLHVNNILNLDEFKVRNNRLNPIFKNTLFQMLTKDQKRRLEFNEIKRRLSLQKFISI